MKFWRLLRWLGIAVFLAIVLLGLFATDRGHPSRTGSDADIRLAPNFVR